MEVDVALHMGVGDRVRQHGEGGRLGHRARQQIALGGVDVGILVGVLAHQSLVTVHQTLDGFVDVGGLGTFDVFVQTVVGVRARHIVQVVFDQAVFNEILDVFDLGGTVVTILDFGFDLLQRQLSIAQMFKQGAECASIIGTSYRNGEHK